MGKHHNIVTPETEIHVGDTVMVNGERKEIARLSSDHGTMFTDGTWL